MITLSACLKFLFLWPDLVMPILIVFKTFLSFVAVFLFMKLKEKNLCNFASSNSKKTKGIQVTFRHVISIKCGEFLSVGYSVTLLMKEAS